VYYGDESARSLLVEWTVGDATLRSFMNWDAIKNNPETQSILKHWQKLGQFRANHPAVGTGINQMITASPYLFHRSFSKGDFKDLVVVGLDLPIGKKVLDVSKVFENGDELRDVYSGISNKVVKGKFTLESKFKIVLLEKT
jgi:alpha-amylase